MVLPNGTPTINDLLYNWLQAQGAGGSSLRWHGEQINAGTTDIAGAGKVLAAGEKMTIRDIQVGGDESGKLEVSIGGTVMTRLYFDANDTRGFDYDEGLEFEGPGTVVANLTLDGAGSAFAIISGRRQP
jgi:hypothetical protein